MVYQLIDLDEVAGSFDKEGNAKIEEARRNLKARIEDLNEFEDFI